MADKLKNKRFENKKTTRRKEKHSDMFKMEISVINSDRRFVHLAWNTFNDLLAISEALCVSTFSFRTECQKRRESFDAMSKNHPKNMLPKWTQALVKLVGLARHLFPAECFLKKKRTPVSSQFWLSVFVNIPLLNIMHFPHMLLFFFFFLNVILFVHSLTVVSVDMHIFHFIHLCTIQYNFITAFPFVYMVLLKSK